MPNRAPLHVAVDSAWPAARLLATSAAHAARCAHALLRSRGCAWTVAPALRLCCCTSAAVVWCCAWGVAPSLRTGASPSPALRTDSPRGPVLPCPMVVLCPRVLPCPMVVLCPHVVAPDAYVACAGAFPVSTVTATVDSPEECAERTVNMALAMQQVRLARSPRR